MINKWQDDPTPNGLAKRIFNWHLFHFLIQSLILILFHPSFNCTSMISENKSIAIIGDRMWKKAIVSLIFFVSLRMIGDFKNRIKYRIFICFFFAKKLASFSSNLNDDYSARIIS